MKKSQQMEDLVKEMDNKMSERSFQYFFETVLGFDTQDMYVYCCRGQSSGL